MTHIIRINTKLTVKTIYRLKPYVGISSYYESRDSAPVAFHTILFLTSHTSSIRLQPYNSITHPSPTL